MVVLFEFQPDLFRYSSGGSVGGVDDRDQVTGPQDISGEVAAGRCGLGFRHRLLTREQNGLFGPAADFVVRRACGRKLPKRHVSAGGRTAATDTARGEIKSYDHGASNEQLPASHHSGRRSRAPCGDRRQVLRVSAPPPYPTHAAVNPAAMARLSELTDERPRTPHRRSETTEPLK
jgi:hypothetical protein